MRRALGDFQTSLGRIRALADEIKAKTIDALADSRVLALHETQQCAAVVLLAGYFEAFLKDLVREYVDQLSLSGLSFFDLPLDIQNRHFEGGGQVLTRASFAARKGRTTPFGGATREDIAARLQSPFAGTGSYRVVWEAFADTKANPSPDVVKEIGKSLGLKEFWPSIAKGSGNSVRWSQSALTKKLQDLIDKRNESAHTGRVSPIPTAADLLDFTEMLEALGTGFVVTLETELQEHKAKLAARTTASSASPP